MIRASNRKKRKHNQNVGYNCEVGKLRNFLFSSYNVFLALLLVLIALPIYCIISLFVLLFYGRPIFYKGKRLGLGKRIFYMYKFRTLPTGFDKKIGAELFSRKPISLPYFAKFLRETRLDELPQLFNIIKRDMDFLGPRPLRPEIYEKWKDQIPNYDLRFNVRPGLVGVSQIYTPHSTSKRLRGMIDAKLSAYKCSFFLNVYLIFVAIYTSIKKLIIYFFKYIKEIYFLKIYKHKRKYDRIKPRETVNIDFFQNDKLIGKGSLYDANDDFIKVHSSVDLNEDDYLLKLYIPTIKNKIKIARVRCKKVNENKDSNEYLFLYEPISELNKYFIDQYLLNKSLFIWSKITIN